jgi:hypothetical protein
VKTIVRRAGKPSLARSSMITFADGASYVLGADALVAHAGDTPPKSIARKTAAAVTRFMSVSLSEHHANRFPRSALQMIGR